MSEVFDTFDAGEEILASYASEWGFGETFAKMKIAREAGDKKGLIHEANELWFELPDSASIRTRGFFILCDIAEQIFEEEPS